MATWPIRLQLAADGAPLYRRIALAIIADIQRGRLRPGERLPSSRALASQLGVNRNTISAAYDDLRAQGWIEIESARGAFVVEAPAGESVRYSAEPAADGRFPSAAGYDLPREFPVRSTVPRSPNLLLLLGGVPDLRLLPHRQLARAYRLAMRGARGQRLLDYADPQGNPRLRAALGDLMARVRGCPAPPEAICVVRGSQHGLYLAAAALLPPGAGVAVEACGYSPAWQALRLAGAALHPIPIDGEGLDISALERAVATQRVRAVYLTPHHQYPTGVALSPPRRAQLLALARRERLMVFEDDYDFDFHYEGRPLLPLVADDAHGVVVYFGTMSKSLAPGLRLGYVVAPPDVIRRIVAYRSYTDGQGDHVLEHAVATLLEDGEIQRHASRARRAYRGRRDALCEALRSTVPQLSFVPPSGGMAVWARAPGIDTDAWVSRGLRLGVAFQAASRFDFEGRAGDGLRIGFAACTEQELAEAAARMARALVINSG